MIFFGPVPMFHAQPPTWRTRVSFFVLPIVLGLSGNGGPNRSLSSHQLSPQSHLGTQASSPRPGDDTVKDELVYLTV